MRIFLTGGTGFVGGHLRDALVADGHAVTALTRHEQPTIPGVTWVEGDLGHNEHLVAGMQGCDAVVHLVGIIRETRHATFEGVHVDGTRHVLSAMETAGVTRLLHMSALGANPKADTAYYRTKWEAEELVRASGVDFTIFRPSLIFGPGDGFFTMLARQLRLFPIIPIIGSGQFPFAPVSITAVAAAFVQALTLDSASRKTLELCGPEVLTYEQIVDLLMAHLHIRKLKVHIPLWFMRFVTGTASIAHLPSPITEDQLNMLLKGNVCDDYCVPDSFHLPQITLREGVGEYLHPVK